MGFIFFFTILSAYFLVFTTKHMFWWNFSGKTYILDWVVTLIKIIFIGFLAWGAPYLVMNVEMAYGIPVWIPAGIFGVAIGGGFFLVYVSVYYVLLHRSKKVKVRRVIKDERVA